MASRQREHVMRNDVDMRLTGITLAVGQESRFRTTTAAHDATHFDALVSQAWRYETAVHAGYVTARHSSGGVRAEAGREMRGSGTLEVDGRYTAYGQRLQITRGRLVWANTAVGDPLLDIRAEREVGDVTAGIRVEGRASAPRATVYSDPARSESEALAYLTLGRPLSSLTGDEARQLGTAKSALSVGTSLLASELGTRLGLDDAGVVESRALGSEVLSVGKYLSPKLYVGYGVSLLGTGQVLI